MRSRWGCPVLFCPHHLKLLGQLQELAACDLSPNLNQKLIPTQGLKLDSLHSKLDDWKFGGGFSYIPPVNQHCSKCNAISSFTSPLPAQQGMRIKLLMRTVTDLKNVGAKITTVGIRLSYMPVGI